MPVVSRSELYLFSRSASQPPQRRSRRLRLESLEARHALSTLLDSGVDECLSLEPALDTDVVEIADLQTATETVSAPLESDAYFDSLGGTTAATEDSPTTTPTSDPSTVGLPVPTGAPPTIFQFQGDSSGSLLTLRGLVGDDKPVYLCHVEFSGGVTGSTSVLADGTFSYQTVMPPPGTTIFARAVDADGMYSGWFEVAIIA